MRRRERVFFLLLAFALLELSFTAIERVALRRKRLARRTRLATSSYRRDAARGILHSTP